MTENPRETSLERLALFSQDRIRTARWNAIENARRQGATWAQIGDALGTVGQGAMRIHRNDRDIAQQAQQAQRPQN